MVEKAYKFRCYLTPQHCQSADDNFVLRTFSLQLCLSCQDSSLDEHQERVDYKPTSAMLKSGSHHDREINANINILAAELAVSVWVAGFRPGESKSRIYGCYEAESP